MINSNDFSVRNSLGNLYIVPKVSVHKVPLSWKPSKHALKKAGVKNLSFAYQGTSNNTDLIAIFKAALDFDRNHELRKGFTSFYGTTREQSKFRNIATYLSYSLNLPEDTDLAVCRHAKTENQQIELIQFLYFSLLSQNIIFTEKEQGFSVSSSLRNLVKDCTFFKNKSAKENTVLTEDDWNTFVFLTQWKYTGMDRLRNLYEASYKAAFHKFGSASEKLDPSFSSKKDQRTNLQNLVAYSDVNSRVQLYNVFSLTEIRNILPLIFTEAELKGIVEVKTANPALSIVELKNILISPEPLRRELFGW